MPQTLLSTVAGTTRPPLTGRHAPLRLWLALVLFAVAGSCLYGASLAWVLPGWKAIDAAVWLAASSGLAWCVFIPSLRWALGIRWEACIHAALVTMAGGEVVLLSGALLNALLAAQQATAHAVLLNAGLVTISNVAMAALLAGQLHLRGIPVRRTLALWLLVLNGTGALFFTLLYRTLHGA